MNILYISQLFQPEPGAPPERISQLTRRWVKMGHKVTVLTGYPNHPYGKLYAGYGRKLLRLTSTDWDQGVKIVRSPFIFRPNHGGINRMLAFSSFAMSAMLRSILMPRYDVVIGTFPQPLQPIAAWLKSRLNRSKFVFEVRDLWPETIVATGLADERSYTYRGIHKVVKFLYSRADHCVAVTTAAKAVMSDQYGVDPDQIDVVPAGVMTEAFSSEKRTRLEGKFRVIYSGTTGNSQGLEVLIRAAKLVQEKNSEIEIELVGGGAEWAQLVSLAEELGVENIKFTGQVIREDVPSYLANSDMALAILRDSPVFKTAVPTKLYEYMAAGLPIISNVQGEAADLLAKAGAGVTVPAGNPECLAHEILRMFYNPGLRQQFGESGTAFVASSASWQVRAEKYIEVLKRVVSDS